MHVGFTSTSVQIDFVNYTIIRDKHGRPVARATCPPYHREAEGDQRAKKLRGFGPTQIIIKNVCPNTHTEKVGPLKGQA